MEGKKKKNYLAQKREWGFQKTVLLSKYITRTEVRITLGIEGNLLGKNNGARAKQEERSEYSSYKFSRNYYREWFITTNSREGLKKGVNGTHSKKPITLGSSEYKNLNKAITRERFYKRRLLDGN